MRKTLFYMVKKFSRYVTLTLQFFYIKSCFSWIVQFLTNYLQYWLFLINTRLINSGILTSIGMRYFNQRD